VCKAPPSASSSRSSRNSHQATEGRPSTALGGLAPDRFWLTLQELPAHLVRAIVPIKRAPAVREPPTPIERATISGVILKIPPELATNCQKIPERLAWLDRLPDMLQELRHRWSLTLDVPLDGEEGSCSYVTAVKRADGTPAVLKVGMPHMEGEHEIDGLRSWNGDPTVRLLDADEELGAMLLERCEPGTPLRLLPEQEQDVVISGLLRRLWRSPSESHRFRPLSVLTEHWSNETLAQVTYWPDAELVREGLRLFAELPRSSAIEVVLATDLHPGNVLRAEREPWLVIDPKPFVGDPAYDATQHLFNCFERLRSDPDGTIRRFADLLGIDHERIRLWTFARAAAEPRDNWSNSDRLVLARVIAP
jgi:streptomycin 6-kinase